MQSLDIKADELYEKIQNLDALNSELFRTFDEAKAQMESLQGEWESQTSEVVFDNFSKMIKLFQKIKAGRTTDFNFLKKTHENYVSMENSIDGLIDEYVATSDANFFSDADKKATVDYTSGLSGAVVTVNNPNNMPTPTNPEGQN